MNIATLGALRATRALITDPEHFTTGVLARNHEGRRCNSCDAEASSWCVMGAWRHAIASDDVNSDKTLRELCDYENIAHVNDSWGHEAVLKMLDKAIETAEDEWDNTVSDQIKHYMNVR